MTIDNLYVFFWVVAWVTSAILLWAAADACLWGLGWTILMHKTAKLSPFWKEVNALTYLWWLLGGSLSRLFRLNWMANSSTRVIYTYAFSWRPYFKYNPVNYGHHRGVNSVSLSEEIDRALEE